MLTLRITLRGKCYFCSDEETEAQRGDVTCL